MLEDESAHFLLYGSRHIPQSGQNQSFNLTVSSFYYLFLLQRKAPRLVIFSKCISNMNKECNCQNYF